MPHPPATWQLEQNLTGPSSMPPPPPPPPPAEHKTRLFHTSFYWGKDTQILFHGWPGTSTGMYVLALFFVFALAVLVEFLSCLAKCFKPGSNRAASCMFQTGLHAIRTGLAYLVVLALTSFNGGVFIAALLGHALGYSFFRSGLCFAIDD